MSTDEADAAPPPEAASPAASRPSLAWLGILAGGAVGVGLVLLGMSLLRPGLPLLNRDAWKVARSQWYQREPANYDLEIRVIGAQESLYRIEVRDRRVSAATRNGDPLRDPRTWETWSVPGMFDTLAADLDAVAGDARQPPANLLLRARFDPEWGVPLEYQRYQFDPPFDAHWHVTRFDPLP